MVDEATKDIMLFLKKDEIFIPLELSCIAKEPHVLQCCDCKRQFRYQDTISKIAKRNEGVYVECPNLDCLNWDHFEHIPVVFNVQGRIAKL